ncbi:DUF262 domain-containing protein [Micromonospora aurantiaca]|uniref:DUF262 domain-containing protein n=1 Tax=Micromonospora aurantiaca (nom. illeg.) TaxID=47850 RepID=A0A6N3K6K6_9ACTN|nr:DUF262 domain-containing protein [Micromonospora aurantiaca]
MSEQVTEILEELDSLGRATGIEFDDAQDARADQSIDAIHTPFDPERIDVVTRNTTVDLLLSRIRTGRVDLQPDFQRQAGIWKAMAKSRLIESLLLRIPLPTFYAAEGEDEAWAMVDGIQRLTTIAEFIEPKAIGRDPLRLVNLEYLGAEYDGRTFDELPGRLQTRLRETELIVHLIRRGTPEEVKFNIFARINTGGLPLSRQELRHALIPGKGREILRDWAESDFFRSATRDSVRSERMVDREMILRFIAFRLTSPYDYDHDDFDRFLRESMGTLNTLPASQVDQLWNEFGLAMMAARNIFGPYAFRKRDRSGGSRRMPINKALFEAISVNLAELGGPGMATLMDRRQRVEDEFIGLMSDVDFQGAISQGTGDPGKVRIRFGIIREVFESVMGR